MRLLRLTIREYLPLLIVVMAMEPSPGNPGFPFESELEQSYFKPWATRSSRITSSESVSPLSALPPKRPDYFAQTRASWSDRATLDVDYPPRPPVRPLLPDRSITQSTYIAVPPTPEVSSSLRPKCISRNSMTETAARWSDLIDKSLVKDSVHEVPIKTIKALPLNSLASSEEGHGHGIRRWEHSNHWFKVGVGRQRPQLKRSAVTDSVIETYNPNNPLLPPLAFELTTIRTGIPEIAEQESPAITHEPSLILPLTFEQGQEIHKTGAHRRRWSQRLLSYTKQKLRVKQARIFHPFTKSKGKNLGTKPNLPRTSTMLSKLLTSRKHHKSLRSSIAEPTTTFRQHGIRHLRTSSRESDDDSLHERLLTHPRPTTPPDPSQWYTSTDNQLYRRVDFSLPNAPCFLPSEAARISTPPLPSTMKGRLRGYFFDIGALGGTDSQATRPRTKKSKASTNIRSSTASSDPVWFRVMVEGSGDPAVVNGFLQDIPDHLPSSPLCPKNPKHTSGGTGTCPMHGRNRSPSLSSQSSG